MAKKYLLPIPYLYTSCDEMCFPICHGGLWSAIRHISGEIQPMIGHAVLIFLVDSKWIQRYKEPNGSIKSTCNQLSCLLCKNRLGEFL